MNDLKTTTIKSALYDLIQSIENDMQWDADDFVSQDRYELYKSRLETAKEWVSDVTGT